MSNPSNLFSHLKTGPNIKKDPEYLDRDGRSEAFRNVAESELRLKVDKQKLRDIFAADAKAKGLQPAFVKVIDLIEIISNILITGCSITKAFRDREQNANLCKGWAKRTITQSPAEYDITQAIHSLDPIAKDIIELMDSYSVLDIKIICKARSFSEALNRMKKQHTITKELKKKDDEIARLKNDLANMANNNLNANILNSIKQGTSVAATARNLNISRGTVYNHLNKP